MEQGKRIITDHIKPPIPIRHHDWVAYKDGDDEEGPHGYGRTEAEAIEDLKTWLDSETCVYCEDSPALDSEEFCEICRRHLAGEEA